MESGDKKTRDAEIISHWYKPFDGFQTATQDFYTVVQQAIAKREMPQVRFERVSWQESGLLSAKREYLRVEWRRYIYDICVAPVGTGCFFSSWLCLRKLKLTIWHIAGIATSLFLLLLFLFTIILVIPYIGALIFLAWLLRTGNMETPPFIEEFLYGLTIVIPIIDVYHRAPSYFEIDTASMFQSVVHTAFLEVIDTLTEAKGIPRMTEMDRKPAMRDFFKR